MDDLLGQDIWGEYRDLINDGLETFGKNVVIWKKFVPGINRWGEDNSDGNFTSIPLSVLCNYNYMRSWPITMATESGELDRQSVQLYISYEWLKQNNYLTTDNNLSYDPAMDRFIMDGLTYKASGDTPVSQAKSINMMLSIIIKREETDTSYKVRP